MVYQGAILVNKDSTYPICDEPHTVHLSEKKALRQHHLPADGLK